MINTGFVYRNLKSALAALGNSSAARYMENPRAAIFYDSGVHDAYENYALLDQEGILRETRENDNFNGFLDSAVKCGEAFFMETARPHIWPVFFELTDETRLILTANGLSHDEDFTAMQAGLDCPTAVSAVLPEIEAVKDIEDIDAWADCAWRGFDSDDCAPENFLREARYMASRDDFHLAHIRGQATGLLFFGEKTGGIYYVSVKPEFRGRGLGGAMVEYLKNAARERGFQKTTLLATPAGLPLYLKHGFKSLGTVSIWKSYTV